MLKDQELSFNALPGVPEELNGIVRAEGQFNSPGILPGTVKLDESFNLDALETAIELDRSKVLHIASHFRFNADNRDSFLLLGNNGALTLSDFNGFSLSGVELLTLSACDTAGILKADGREIEGLGMSAQSKGAKAVIATLWSVADRSTSLLMQEFYKQRAQSSVKSRSLPKAEALRQAQLSLLYGKDYLSSYRQSKRGPVVAGEKTASSRPNSDAPFAHPYYWAPFILIGNAR
jgi:CHAT domain-containing protein